MNDDDFKNMNKVELLEKYVKIMFLVDFYSNSWIRWMELFENAAESIDILDGIIDSMGDDIECEVLEEYKAFYEEALEELTTKTATITEKLVLAEDRKSILFAEICRRKVNLEVSRYKDVIESRTLWFYRCMEGDV